MCFRQHGPGSAPSASHRQAGRPSHSSSGAVSHKAHVHSSTVPAASTTSTSAKCGIVPWSSVNWWLGETREASAVRSWSTACRDQQLERMSVDVQPLAYASCVVERSVVFPNSDGAELAVSSGPLSSRFGSVEAIARFLPSGVAAKRR